MNMFAKPLAHELSGHAMLVGVCDPNPVRAEGMSKQAGGPSVFTDFDDMLRSVKPDAVIITTPDHLHDEYIIRSLEAGCDAISEKPITIDAVKCRSILEAERRSGKRVIVTFNCRFMPFVVRIKELLQEGAIGDIHGVTMDYMLDTSHGADYFRRWHRQMKHSGGLLVHKSTHHFDMVNWWLNDEPDTVFANGARYFYGPTREARGERCLNCRHKAGCEFYYDLSADRFASSLYLEAESHDGYYRDQCVFGEDIDIYDTMSVTVKYRRGAMLTYALNAYSPYEGWKVSITGSKGRLEAEEMYTGPHAGAADNEIRLYACNGELVTYRSNKAIGGHGGGDSRLRRMIFVGDVADPLGQMAGSRAGAMSLLIGAAANTSIAEGRSVAIGEWMGG